MRLALLMVTLCTLCQASPEILVSTAWLAEHLGDSGLVLLHVGTLKDYGDSHIPGARLVTLADVSIKSPGDLQLELPPAEVLQKKLEELGISDDSRVIIYAGTDSVQSATRVWFTLDYAGLGDRAALLDGGLALWRAEGRPLTAERPPEPARGKLNLRPGAHRLADADWLRRHTRDESVQILDARLPEFYSGEAMGFAAQRKGRIPGARNVPFTSLLQAGKLRSREELREALGSKPVVSYCHLGQQATVLYFAARLLGLEARLYDGSFQDWSARADWPVETDSK